MTKLEKSTDLIVYDHFNKYSEGLIIEPKKTENVTDANKEKEKHPVIYAEDEKKNTKKKKKTTKLFVEIN